MLSPKSQHKKCGTVLPENLVSAWNVGAMNDDGLLPGFLVHKDGGHTLRVTDSKLEGA